MNFGMQYIPTHAIHLINYNKKAKLIPTLQLVCCPKKDSISPAGKAPFSFFREINSCPDFISVSDFDRFCSDTAGVSPL